MLPPDPQYGRGNEQYGRLSQYDQYDSNQRQYSRTPNAFSRQSVDFNDQFHDNNENMDRNSGYRKRTTPPTPPQMYSPARKPGTPTWKKKNMAPPPPPPSNRMNPITELQQRGRQAMGDQDNGDNMENPPFNFQGMLRKTSHNRSSMKRSASEQNYNQFSNNNDQQSNMVYSSSSRGKVS
jgi:myosin III